MYLRFENNKVVQFFNDNQLKDFGNCAGFKDFVYTKMHFNAGDLPYVVFSDGKIKFDTNAKESAKMRTEKQLKIFDLKAELVKVKENIEQVDLFGMIRNDTEQKRIRAAEIVNELRELEGIRANY